MIIMLRKSIYLPFMYNGYSLCPFVAFSCSSIFFKHSLNSYKWSKCLICKIISIGITLFV